MPSKLNNERPRAVLRTAAANAFAFANQTSDQDVRQYLFRLLSELYAALRASCNCWSVLTGLLRKEVIQPLVLERLPCYDFTPIIEPTFDRALLSVRLRASGVPDSHGVTGGVYKARERIHRGMLIRDY